MYDTKRLAYSLQFTNNEQDFHLIFQLVLVAYRRSIMSIQTLCATRPNQD